MFGDTTILSSLLPSTTIGPGARVRAAIDGLDDAHRMVFVLAHYEGMRYREIAEILEIPVGTVKSRMAAAERTGMCPQRLPRPHVASPP